MVLKENWVKNWKTLETYFVWTSTLRYLHFYFYF